jgi:hypothetical protein
MEIKKISNAEYFRTNAILYWALILGVIMANAIIVFMFLNETIDNMFEEINFPIAAIALGITIVGIFLSRMLFRKKMEAIQALTKLAEKMSAYKAALIIKYALIEFPAFACLILFSFSYEVLIIGVLLVIIGYYLSEKPSRQRCYTDLGLNESEKMLLDDPDGRICETTLQ